MWVLTLLLGVAWSLDAVPVNESAALFYDNRLDHFDETNPTTFKQQYTVNATGWEKGNPVFIFLGGEAPIEFFEFQEVSARKWASDFNAMYIELEHRYYGKSVPGGTFATSNMRYLSSEQALADAAAFITDMQTKYPGPWVVFGCSYSGALSAWFRMKYPHLVVASVAPSGPVFATTNFTDYYLQFQKVAPTTCVAAVQAAAKSVLSMLDTAKGRASLAKTFNACAPIPDTAAEQEYFLLSLTEAIGGSDQFENPPEWPLNSTCKTLTSSSDWISNWAKILGSPDNKCNDFNYTSSFLEPMQDPKNADRAWFWQKCTEFGWFKPTYGSVFFPGRLELAPQVAQCASVFGIKDMTPDTTWTNTNYGGYGLKGSSILFTNGVFDPWHTLSVTKDSGGVHTVMYDAGHCAPMTLPTKDDPPSLTSARAAVKLFLSGILGGGSS